MAKEKTSKNSQIEPRFFAAKKKKKIPFHFLEPHETAKKKDSMKVTIPQQICMYYFFIFQKYLVFAKFAKALDDVKRQTELVVTIRSMGRTGLIYSGDLLVAFEKTKAFKV